MKLVIDHRLPIKHKIISKETLSIVIWCANIRNGDNSIKPLIQTKTKDIHQTIYDIVLLLSKFLYRMQICACYKLLLLCIYVGYIFYTSKSNSFLIRKNNG